MPDGGRKGHGEQTAAWPTDPYLFRLHCGYPASEAKCAKGWGSLTSQIGVDAERILKAKMPFRE